MTISVTNAGPGRRHPARAADGLVPQYLVLGARGAQADYDGDGRRRRPGSSTRSLGPLELLADSGPDGAAPDGPVLRERDQHQAPVRRRSRSRRTRRTASTTTWSTGRPPSTPSAAAPSAPSGTRSPSRRAQTVELRLRLRPTPGRRRAEPGRRVRRRVRPGDGAAAGRGRRVLRRADAAGRDRRRGDGDAAGVRRDAVEQAAVLLRRGPLAGRRSRPSRRRRRSG